MRTGHGKHLIAFGVCAWLSLMCLVGYAEDSRSPTEAPAAGTKTHALPADATAPVIVYDIGGGMIKPLNDDPAMVIRADGSVTLGNRYRNDARIETRISEADLHALLRLAIDANGFFEINAAEIKQAIDAKLKQENEQLKAHGIVRVGARGIADAATTVVRIQADGQDHEVQYYALDMQFRDDERLTRLHNIVMRLRAIRRKLISEAANENAPGGLSI